jgi:hypothetical protein
VQQEGGLAPRSLKRASSLHHEAHSPGGAASGVVSALKGRRSGTQRPGILLPHRSIDAGAVIGSPLEGIAASDLVPAPGPVFLPPRGGGVTASSASAKLGKHQVHVNEAWQEDEDDVGDRMTSERDSGAKPSPLLNNLAQVRGPAMTVMHW